MKQLEDKIIELSNHIIMVEDDKQSEPMDVDSKTIHVASNSDKIKPKSKYTFTQNYKIIQSIDELNQVSIVANKFSIDNASVKY